jgi:hypothetical protein
VARINFVGHGSNVIGSLSSGSVVLDMPSAMQLNGTDAYASGSTTMSTVTGTTATIAMWVYYTGSQTNQGEKVLFSDSSSETRKILMQTRNYDSHGVSFRFGYVDSAGGGLASKDTGGAAGVLTSGAWQHFAIVTDGNNVSLHVDGVLLSDGTYASAGTHSYAIANPHLGRAAFSDGRYFPGYIRDVQVYNVSSSATQLGQIMMGELPHGTPIHWWTCDDGATNDDGSATDSDLTLTNTVQDKSKYHLNQVGSGSIGSDTSKVTFDVSGGTWNLRDSTYLDFDGTDDKVEDTSASSMPTTKGTLSCWFNSDDLSSEMTLVDIFDASDSSNQRALLYYHGSGELRFIVAGTLVASYAYSASELAANQWHQYTATYNTTDDEYKIYLDGELKTTSTTTASDNSGIDTIRVGSDKGNSYDFNGQIKDVMIYDSVLTDAQINLLHKGQWTGAPVTWWKFNEGTGNATDSGTASNTGTVTNATWVNPPYEIRSSGNNGGNLLNVTSGTTLDAPRGEFMLRALSAPSVPAFRINGSYIHNSGTLTFSGNTTTDWYPANAADNTNTFYKIKQAGTKPQWHRGNWTVEDSINLQGNLRAYAHAGHTEGHTLTLGTTGAAGTVSGSAYIQAMTTNNQGSKIKSASPLFPATLSGTHSDFGCMISPYRLIQVEDVILKGSCKTGNNGFENTATLKLIGDVVWGDKAGGGAEIKFPLTDSASNDTGQTLDVSGASVSIEIPLFYMSGNCDVSDAILRVNKFSSVNAKTWTSNAGSKIIYQNATAANTSCLMPELVGSSKQMKNSQYGSTITANTNIGSDLIIGELGGNQFIVGSDGDGTHLQAGSLYLGGHSNNGIFQQNHNTVTLSGSTITSVGGIIGYSRVNFRDGETDYMTVTHSANIDPTTTDEFTWECWVKPENTASNTEFRWMDMNTIVWLGGTDSDDADGEYKAKFNIYDGSSNQMITGTSNITDGNWHHLAATYKSTSMKLYVDGHLEASGTASDIGTISGSPALNIGRYDAGSPSAYAFGSLGRMSVWKTELTHAQLREMYLMNYTEMAAAMDETKCMAWFQFDGNSASTNVYNLSASSSAGTLANSSAWDLPYGYGNWLGSTGSAAELASANNQLYLTSTNDIYLQGNSLRLGNISGGATSGKKLHMTRWAGEQCLQVYGAMKWGPGTTEQNNSAAYGRNSSPWNTVSGIGYIEPLGGNTQVPFADWQSYWSSSGSLSATNGLTSGIGGQPEVKINHCLPTSRMVLAGDLTMASQMMPSVSSHDVFLETQGHDLIMPQWYIYGGSHGKAQLDAGTTVYFVNDNDGFTGTSTSLMQIHASGEACVQFYGDDNDGYGNYITIPKTTALDFGNSAFTMTYWAKIGDAADEEYIISNMNSSDSSWPGFRFGLKSGDLNNQINDNSGGGGEKRFDTNISAGTWKHIAIVVSGTGGDMVCYVDGSIPVAGQSLGTYASLNNDKTVKIGGAYAGETQNYNGSIADVRFYKSALSAANITTLSSENPAISVSGAYADPDNALSATVWLKLGITTSGTMDLKNYGTSGSANDGTWVTTGSPPRLGKSGVVRIMPSGTTTNWDINEGIGDRDLTNFYSSGSKDIIVAASGTSDADGNKWPGNLITKGTVRFD